VQLRPGVENEFVRRQARVGHSGCHVVSRTVDNEIPKERLTLPESAVESIPRVKLVQTIEKRRRRGRPQSLQIGLRLARRCNALVAVVVAFVAVVVDEQGNFSEVALLPLVAGEVADDVAVDGGAVEEVSEGVEGRGGGVVGVYVGLLGGCFEGGGV
jgi:hypothetical protein